MNIWRQNNGRVTVVFCVVVCFENEATLDAANIEKKNEVKNIINKRKRPG